LNISLNTLNSFTAFEPYCQILPFNQSPIKLIKFNTLNPVPLFYYFNLFVYACRGIAESDAGSVWGPPRRLVRWSFNEDGPVLRSFSEAGSSPERRRACRGV